MFNKLLGLAIVAASFAGSAQASELASVHHHYFLGHWSCIGHVHTPDGKRFDTVGSWKIKKAFHGHVYDKFENYTGTGFSYVAKGMTTYDKLAGVLNRHVISNMGTWTRYVSKGWDDDTFSWNGESHRFGRPPLSVGEVITKKDDNTFEVRLRVQDHDGYARKDGVGGDNDDGWTTMYKGTCTRNDGGHGGGHGGGGKDDGKADGTDQGKQDDTQASNQDGDEDFVAED